MGWALWTCAAERKPMRWTVGHKTGSRFLTTTGGTLEHAEQLTCSCRSLAISSFSRCSSSRLCSSSIMARSDSFSLASRSYSCRSRARRSVDSSKAPGTVEERSRSEECQKGWWQEWHEHCEWRGAWEALQPYSGELTQSPTQTVCNTLWHDQSV